MADLLEGAIESLRDLPKDKQAVIIDLLLDLADTPPGGMYILSPEEERLIDEGLADLDNGRIASQAEVDAVFAKYRR